MRKFRVRILFKSNTTGVYMKYYVIQEKKWWGWKNISEPMVNKVEVMADCEECNQLYNQFR